MDFYFITKASHSDVENITGKNCYQAEKHMKQKKHGNMLVIAEIFAFGSIIQDLKYNDADK